MKRIKIPFDGFYESITDSFLDGEIESEVEYREQEKMPAYTDFSFDFKGLASEYVSAFKSYLESEHGLKLESLEFESLIMPKEYNFTTDIIYCSVSDEDIQKLYHFAKLPLSQNLQEKINERFKSRDGFASFYEDFVDEWETKPILEWDHNELSVLFPEPDYYELWDTPRSNGVFQNHIPFTE